jgi:GT2 family glycosyltransferase
MSAVTGACMMVKRSVFDEAGSFSPDFQNSFCDIDLCMKIRRKGYLIVWTPYAEAYHYESKTRGYHITPEKQRLFIHEIALFKEKWAKELKAGDPYYNINFSLDKSDYSFS